MLINVYINNACAVGPFQLMFLHVVRVLYLTGLGCTYPYNHLYLKELATAMY